MLKDSGHYHRMKEESEIGEKKENRLRGLGIKRTLHGEASEPKIPHINLQVLTSFLLGEDLSVSSEETCPARKDSLR